jgi:hypothetical protein
MTPMRCRFLLDTEIDLRAPSAHVDAMREVLTPACGAHAPSRSLPCCVAATVGHNVTGKCFSAPRLANRWYVSRVDSLRNQGVAGARHGPTSAGGYRRTDDQRQSRRWCALPRHFHLPRGRAVPSFSAHPGAPSHRIPAPTRGPRNKPVDSLTVVCVVDPRVNVMRSPSSRSGRGTALCRLAGRADVRTEIFPGMPARLSSSWLRSPLGIGDCSTSSGPTTLAGTIQK